MLITFSGHRQWIVVSFLIVAAATAYYIPYQRNALNGPTGSSWPGLVYGIVGMVLMGYAGLLGARRRVPTWRLGRATTWMKGHIWLGLLSLPLIFFHSGFQLGGTLTTVLVALFGIVILSGVFGLLLQQFLPRMMMVQVPMETIYEQIPHVLNQLQQEAEERVMAACWALGNPSPFPSASGQTQTGPEMLDRLSAPLEGSAPLKEFYLHHVCPFLRGSGRDGPLAAQAKAVVLFQQMRTLLPAPLHKTLSDLEAICEERRQLALQTRLHHWLHGWLLVHAPASMALLLLSAAHAVITLRY